MIRHLPHVAILLVQTVACAQTLSPLTSVFRHSALPPTMTFDGARGRLVVANEYQGGTLWEWDGAAWASRSCPQTYVTQLVYDPARQHVFVFGGGSMLEYDGHTFVSRGAIPPVNEVAADSGRGRLVGVGNGTVWEWDGIVWTQRATTGPTAPTVRSGPVYDAAHGRCAVLVRSGSSGPGVYWEWDGATWTQTAVASAPLGTLVYDPGRSEVLCVSAISTVAWNGSTFVPRPSVGAAQDGATRCLAADPASGKVFFLAIDSWQNGFVRVYDGTSWTVACNGPMPERMWTTPTYDQTREVVVLIGGIDPAGRRIPSHFEWDGARWQDLSAVIAAIGPTPRSEHAQVYNPALGETMILGGLTDVGLSDECWTWNGTAWRQLPNLPVAQRRALAVCDSGRGRIIVLGGIDANGLRTDHIEWDGTAWTTVTPTLPFSPLGASIGFDPLRGLTVAQLPGGRQGGFTYQWNGVAWQFLGQSGPTLQGTPLVWNDRSQHLEVLGPGAFSSTGTHLHAYDGNTWQSTELSTDDTYGSAVFDAARGRLDVYQGRAYVGCSLQAATATDFGAPCGVPSGTTAVSAFGLPRLGNLDFHVDLRAPSGPLPAVFGFGFGRGQVPLGNGCTYLLQSPFAALLVLTDGNGCVHEPLPVPNLLAAAGLLVFVQAAVLQNGAPGGFTMSQGLRLQFGD